MMSNSESRKRQAEEACSTPGCPGDSRYAAPGRGHRTDCAYPFAASTVGLAAHEVPDLIEDWLAAHTNAAVEQARAEVEAGWAAAVEALADEWESRPPCQTTDYLHDLRALLTADHTAALDAVKADAAREALLAAADAAWQADHAAGHQWLRARAERHGGGAE